jgi:hypothetical protein
MPTKDKFGPRVHWFAPTFWGMFTKGHCEVYVSFYGPLKLHGPFLIYIYFVWISIGKFFGL